LQFRAGLRTDILIIYPEEEIVMFSISHTEKLFSGALCALLTALLLFNAGCSAVKQPAAIESAASVLDNPLIRVRLVNSVSEITVIPRTAWRGGAPDSHTFMALPQDQAVHFEAKDGQVAMKTDATEVSMPEVVLSSSEPGAMLLIKDVQFGVGWWWEGKQDRTYEGEFKIRPLDNGMIELVVKMPLEDYLLGVVPSEIGATSPQEALRAQAVAARAEALLALITGKYAGKHHDIGSDVDSQAYTGNTKRTPESDEAVRATRGLALYFEDKPLAAYYASSCGGHSEDIRNVWPERALEKGYWDAAGFDSDIEFSCDLTKEDDLREWLASSPETFCNPEKFEVPEWASKNFRWEREVTAEEITKWVAAKQDVGRVTAIRALRRGPSGRMIEAEFVGEKGTFRTGPELAIRQVFDPPLKSAAFIVDTQGPAERPEKFVIRGAGWGHGVGMCQTGAIAMAKAGRNFREILAHYYPKAEVKKVY